MSVPPRDIREDIRRYVPGMRGENSNHGFERLVVLLMGFTGQGKSSLINSSICVLMDCLYRNKAIAGKYEGGKTTKRTLHKLTDTIWISDNRGFAKMKPEEILEVCAQLRHFRQEGDVKWEKDHLQETLKLIPESKGRPTEFILPVIVQSCFFNLKEDEDKSMRMLINKCHEITGIPPVVVITNVGPVNTRSGNVAAMEKRFGEMGCTNRICLENYTENSPKRSPEADNQFLSFLDVCINEAEHTIQQRADLDFHQLFAKHVADQIKEEYEVKQSEWKRECQRMEEELRTEKAKKWYQKCTNQ